MNGSHLESAGRRGMPEGRDLGCFDAGWEVWLSAGGYFGLRVGRGGWGVVAGGEQTSEEAGKAQGGDFNEAAFRAGFRQEGHELRSRRCIDAERLVVSVSRGNQER